jgi:transcriptional regulator with XRE-family HTH domain
MVQGRKTNPSQLRLMARLRAEGRTLAQIALRLGISRQAVHEVLTRKRVRGGPATCRYCQASIPNSDRSNKERTLLCRECLARFPTISFSVRLASLRVMAGMTQAALALATGLSQSLISLAEGNKHQPGRQVRLRLLKFLERRSATRARR